MLERSVEGVFPWSAGSTPSACFCSAAGSYGAGRRARDVEPAGLIPVCKPQPAVAGSCDGRPVRGVTRRAHVGKR